MVNPASQDDDRKRVPHGVFVIVAAFVLLLAVSATAMWKWDTVGEVVAVVGALAGILGAVVGAYVAIDVASAGHERLERARWDAEDARARAELRALRLAGAADPLQAEALLAQRER